MDPFKNKVLAGNQFDGLTASTGLFLPANTGDGRSQVFLNSVKFHTTGGTTTYSLFDVDPKDPDNATLIMTATDDDFFLSGVLLAKYEDRTSWGLRLVTTGMTNDGWFTVDEDAKVTEQ